MLKYYSGLLKYFLGLFKKYSDNYGFKYAILAYSPFILLLLCMFILYIMDLFDLGVEGKGIVGELQNLSLLIGFYGIFFSGLMFILFLLEVLGDWNNKKKFPGHAVASFSLYSFIFLIPIISFLKWIY